MNLQFKHAVLLALTGVFLSACVAETIKVPESELYTREFIKQFGIPNSDHDWNMAQRSWVTVQTSTPTDIKVYAMVKGKRYLFADYSQVKGEQKILFDIPKSVKEVTVRANHRNYTTPIGSTVNLSSSSSRTFGDPVTEMNPIAFSIIDQPKTYPPIAISDYINALEEDENNIGREVNGKPITSNFYFIGTGKPLTFYPLYWDTSSYHALGVYWLNEQGKLDSNCMMDLYYTKSGELEYLLNGKVENPWDENVYIMCKENTEIGKECQKHKMMITENTDTPIKAYGWDDNLNDYNKYYAEDNHIGHYHSYTVHHESEWSAWNGYSNTAYDINAVEKIRSRGITLTVKEGMKYGFYLKVSDKNSLNPQREKLESTEGLELKEESNKDWANSCYYYEKDGKRYYEDYTHHIVFSQAIRNQQFGTPDGAFDKFRCLEQSHIYGKQWSELPTGFEDDAYVQAAYTTLNIGGKSYSYFSFEDWKMRGPDLNDVVFIFDDAYTPSDIPVVDDDEPEEDETYEWIIATEDLAGSFDWDFNDVVFSVKYVISKQGALQETINATITPLASGGTLPVYLMYDGTLNGEEGTHFIGPEFHSWFGVSALTPINVGEKATYKATPITLPLPKDFSLASHKNNSDWDSTSPDNMGGFWVLVDPDKNYGSEAPTSVTTAKASFTKEQINRKVTAPIEKDGTHLAPQMICVGNEWYWPKEKHPIDEVYYNFQQWVTTPETIWYDGTGTHCNLERVTQR